MSEPTLLHVGITIAPRWEAALRSLPPIDPNGQLANRFRDVATGELIGRLAALHVSYLNEMPSEHREELKRCLALLEASGETFANQCLAEIGYRRFPNQGSGDLSRWRAAVKSTALLMTFQELDLDSQVLVGRGLAGSLADRHRLSLSHQVIGALRQCGLAAYGSELIMQNVPADRVDEVHPKTVLLGVSQARFHAQPIYSEVRVDGAVATNRFTIRVTMPDGRWASGHGASKKQAEMAAAAALLSSYTDLIPPPSNAVHTAPVHEIPGEQVTALRLLSREQLADQVPLVVLSEALVHSSYLNESHSSATRDDSRLAFFGQAVIETLVLDRLLAGLWERPAGEEGSLGAREQLNAVTNNGALATWFDNLKLEPALLTSKGQRTNGLTARLKSDTVAAVFAACQLSIGDRLPAPLAALLAEKTESALGAGEAAVRSPKSRLQGFLQMIGIEFDFLREPPDGGRKSVALLLRTGLYAERLTIWNRDTPLSLRAAEDAVAAWTLQRMEEVLSPTPTPISVSPTVLPLARLTLGHVSRALSDPSLPPRRRAAFLARYFQPLELAGVKSWANATQTVISSGGATEELCSEHLASLLSARGLMPSQTFSDGLRDAIVSLSDFANALDPYSDGIDRKSQGFLNLLSAATVARLASRRRAVVSISEVFQEIELLSRKTVRLSDEHGVAETCFVLTREDTLQTFLLELSRLHSASELPVEVVPLPGSFAIRTGISEAAFQKWSSGNLLWQFAKRELACREVSHNGTIAFMFELAFRGPEPAWLRAVANVLVSEEAQAKFGIVSGLLHDFKNQVLAFDAQLTRSTTGRTEELAKRLEASHHADAARSIAVQLQAASDLLQSFAPASVEVRSWFLSYLSEHLKRLPSGVTLKLPTSNDPAYIWTSGEALRTILDNLLKNSFEAVGVRGIIEVDWLFDPDAEELLVEMRNDGPPVPASVQAAVERGESVISAKPGGNGIGLASVHAVLARWGSKLEVRQDADGMVVWSFTVPSLQPARSSDLSIQIDGFNPELEPTSL